MGSVRARVVLCALATLLFALPAGLAAPPYLPIQGILRDAQGQRLDGEFSMRFALYPAVSGGSAIWEETQQVLVEGGLFTLQLGQVESLVLSWFRDYPALWLGLKVGADQEMPRIALGSVPYTGFAAFSGPHTHDFGQMTGTLPPQALPVDLARGPQQCPQGEKASGLGADGSLICSLDLGGSGTTYQIGAGLELQGDTLAVDFQVTQARAEACAAGSAIREIRQDGTVACEQSVSDPGAVLGIIAGCAPDGAIQQIHADGSVDCTGGGPSGNPHQVFDSGWFSAMFRTPMVIVHGQAGEDFVFSVMRSQSDLGGMLSSPIMGNIHGAYANGYVAIGATSVTLTARDYLGAINNLGDRNNLLLSAGEERVRLFNRRADFDSGWMPCAGGNNYILTHSLGAFPDFALVEVAQNADGSGWRVPTMTSSNLPNQNWWAQTNIIALSATQVTIRTHGYLTHFSDTSGTHQAPTAGFCRVRLFLWPPDFDSGWIATSTTAGDRDKLIDHNLGQDPSLYMLYLAQNSDGSGWVIPAMQSYHYSYNYGVGVYALDRRRVTVKGSSGCVAHFVDAAGTAQCPTAGYLRFLAWR